MALQLICRAETADFAAWKLAVEADREDQHNAGLSLLQLWREADASNVVWCLFRVNDRDRAEAYLDRPLAASDAEKAGVRNASYHFVETA